jgi:o-succinylbenzoate synthase
MKLKATINKLQLQFKQPAGTSRGVLHQKNSWIIRITNIDKPSIIGSGECSVIPGLSPDYFNDIAYEQKLDDVCTRIDFYADNLEQLADFPSIRFGVEMALLDLKNGGQQIWFSSQFTQGKKHIPINGLIWMGTDEFMQAQIEVKLKEGFNCIKMKVGAIHFDQEIQLLSAIRKRYTKEDITLRVDANGAFSPEEAPKKLQKLAQLDIHSIEQPIKQGQWETMRELCKNTPLPIALDEELIGITQKEDKQQLLKFIQPQYIILKPSLLGGFQASQEWIDCANERSIPWWMTSALESNLGLNAIAQFTATLNVEIPQGLGTGGLYVNNLDSPLHIECGKLKYG